MEIDKTILKELRRTKYSMYQIAQETGVGPDILSRFINGKVGLSLSSAEKLLRFFGYTLAKIPRPSGLPKLKRGRPKKIEAATIASKAKDDVNTGAKSS